MTLREKVEAVGKLDELYRAARVAGKGRAHAMISDAVFTDVIAQTVSRIRRKINEIEQERGA